MICKLLGTAAAEGIPALFCECNVCDDAAKYGSKNIRGRSGALINEKILIDFPPDIWSYKVKYNLDLAAITHIFFTHSHLDHLASGELCYSHKMYANRKSPDAPLYIYGNEKVLDVIRDAFIFDMSYVPENIVLNKISAFETVEADGVRVTALPAVHDQREECLFYLLEQDRKVLIAFDSGEIKDEVYTYLADKHLDAVVLDCTFGNLEPRRGVSHMCFKDNVHVKQRLMKQGSATGETTFISTHFSHNGLVNYIDFSTMAEGTCFVSAYDGMYV
ncbi:MAG: MBL fold metallo-hydrolase [Defluviitaleaceae bacterium]|nr:MBL fold metallo-hydrolase [Defluviitaleaceae bacterium]